MSENGTAKIDGPMIIGYGIDAIDSRAKINSAGQTSASHAKEPAVINDDRLLVTLGLKTISTEEVSL